MTAFLLSFGWNWLLVPVAIWFLNGLRKAFLNPRIKVLTFTKVPDGYLVNLNRQQLLPPWLMRQETWLVDRYRPSATREGDGRYEDGYENRFPAPSGLACNIAGALRVAIAREQETEELSK
jgi:hypothetical protein